MALASSFLARQSRDVRQRCHGHEGAGGTAQLRRRQPRYHATGTENAPVCPVRQRRGQLAEKFPFDVLLAHHGGEAAHTGGAINFVQGRFNMGSSGVLPFCSEKHRNGFIRLARPVDVAGGDSHGERCGHLLFPLAAGPVTVALPRRLRRGVMTAGNAPLVDADEQYQGDRFPKASLPREAGSIGNARQNILRLQAPASNICGASSSEVGNSFCALHRRCTLGQCRQGYVANVMRATVWDLTSRPGVKRRWRKASRTARAFRSS